MVHVSLKPPSSEGSFCLAVLKGVCGLEMLKKDEYSIVTFQKNVKCMTCQFCICWSQALVMETPICSSSASTFSTGGRYVPSAALLDPYLRLVDLYPKNVMQF